MPDLVCGGGRRRPAPTNSPEIDARVSVELHRACEGITVHVREIIEDIAHEQEEFTNHLECGSMIPTFRIERVA